jgi:hypothetical protein
MWKKYYWRVIGMALSGAGIGLILDEVIQGELKFQLIGHETLGLALLILGGFFISKKPKGKD